MSFYVYRGAEKQGPYDLLGLVRKIKNGTLNPDTPMSIDDEPPMPAVTFKELRIFFDEQESNPVHHAPGDLDLKRSLRGGWSLLQMHSILYLYSGVWMLCSVLFVMLCRDLAVLGTVLAAIPSMLMLVFYMQIILRTSRGQTSDFAKLGQAYARHIPRLLPLVALLALIVGVFHLGIVWGGAVTLVTAVMVVPALFLVTGLAFVPWLVLDQEYGLRDAMRRSMRKVFGSGAQNMGVVFGLIVMQFVGILLLAPIVIVLPIVWGALAEIYDEVFHG